MERKIKKAYIIASKHHNPKHKQKKEQIKIVSQELNFIIVPKWKFLLFLTFFFIDELN